MRELQPGEEEPPPLVDGSQGRLEKSRILVLGGPQVGKTTYARQLGDALEIPVRHTDDLIATHAWSDASDEVMRWIEADGPWVIEGVAVVRGLRKWLVAHPEGAPADHIFVGVVPHVTLTPRQRSMLKATQTIWNEILDAVSVRGVAIEFF
jgi:adenylate kinase family enzyme